MTAARVAVAMLSLATSLTPRAAEAAQVAQAPRAAQGATSESVTIDVAMQSALRRSAAIETAREQVNDSRGARIVAASPFDTRRTVYFTRAHASAMQLLSAQPDFTAVQNDHLEYGFGQQRLLRSGITIAPSMTFSRTDLSTLGARAPGGGMVSLGISVPMLRGRGGGMALATERAADEELGASELDLAQTYSDEAAGSASAYWHYLAAYAQLEAVRRAEERAARLVTETQALVRADERPASDLVQLQATIAAAAAQRLGAEQSLIVARHDLALAMGLPRDRFDALGVPATPFPALSQADTIGADDAARLIREAIDARADLGAARRRTTAAHQLVVGSASERRTRLDVDMSVGYAGLEGGRQFSQLFSPFYRNVAGTNVSLGVSMDLPGEFSSAEGSAMRAAAMEATATRASAERARRAASDVQVAIEAVRHSAAQLERAHEATTLYTRALENERVKFRLGTTTLFDALRTEDALMQATLAEIGANVQHADALTALRYHTGTLVSLASGEPVADVQALRGEPRRAP